jgi:hypothetical protein
MTRQKTGKGIGEKPSGWLLEARIQIWSTLTALLSDKPAPAAATGFDQMAT